MNFCNYAKVIIARNSKDSNSLEWWESKERGSGAVDECISKFSNTVSFAKRYDFYLQVMNKYPKMYISSKAFSMNLSRLQNYITNCKFWKNGNKNGEKSQFLKKFSLQSWYNLPEREKQMHCLMNCNRCETNEPNVCFMHASVSTTTENLISKTSELAQEIQNLHSLRPVDGPEQIVKILEPIIEKTFNKSLQSTVSLHYNLTEKISSEEKQRQKIKASRESSEIISKKISYNENEINTFLASGASFSSRDRTRMATYFETPQSAKSRTENSVKKIRSGLKKPKKHIGKMTNYTYDKQGFKKYITNLKPGSRVSWRNLSIKFNVKNKNGLRPSNAGQVLLEVAKSLGIDVSRFNVDQRICGRDYIQRVRRARHELLYRKISIPTPQPTRKLHTEIRRKITSGELYVGENIAPKTWKRNKISSSGQLEETEITVHGRKIPLENIRRQMNEDQDQFLNIRSDEDYNTLSSEMIHQRFERLNMEVPCENSLEILKQLERTRNLKVWHDHSDILNHSYVSFMISTLYDPAVFLTNQEYRDKYPEKPPVDVQSAVERPYLYILGQSKSSDIDQLSYTSTRLEDIKSLSSPTIHKGIEIHDNLRVFSGDGPARQFEAGQQRGGKFSCLCGIPTKEHSNLECAYQYNPQSLLERVKIFRSGILWKNFSDVNISPLTNLRKDNLRDELEARGIDTFEKTKLEMRDELSSILHGIQRPPALFCTDAEIPALHKYEIPPVEPLHDLTNVIQNLITELPVHIENKMTQVEFEKFSNITVRDKNQLKGSDARLFAVKLAKFAAQKFAEKKITLEILQLCTCLVDIVSICYSNCSQRTPKKILRLYNQCFLFSLLCKSIIGTPQKMTARKFYGCHFHCLTVHAPQTFRLFCLRSLVPEQEERSFGDLRRISLNTSNRQCGQVIENAILRFNAQQTDRGDSFRKQETIISQQAKLLPQSEDSKFPMEILQSRPYLFQMHCQRIADFLQLGQNTWWSLQGEHVVFHDGPSHPEQPFISLQHFRSASIQDTTTLLKNAWQTCIQDFEMEKIQLPLLKLKLFEGNKTRIVRNHKLLKHIETTDITPKFQFEKGSIDVDGLVDNVEVDEDIPRLEDEISLVQDLCTGSHDDQEKHGDDHSLVNFSIHQLPGPQVQNTENAKVADADVQLPSDDSILWRKCTDKLTKVDQTKKRESTKLTLLLQKPKDKECNNAICHEESKSCKRQLFSEGKHVKENLEKEKESTARKILSLLQGDPTVVDYLKYRRLLKTRPHDQMLVQSYEVALAKVQTAVSKRHTELKKTTRSCDAQLIEDAENLMRHWGMYFF